MKTIVANWKMNLTINQATALADKIVDCNGNNANVVICPSFTQLAYVRDIFANSKIKLGAQNVAAFENGAFTGEISAQMLIDAGCQYVIVGHSERRTHLLESNQIIAQKIKLATIAGLRVILCIGESKETYSLNKTQPFLENQLIESLATNNLTDKIMIAYEPTWSIGSNIIPDNTTIYKITQFIKKTTQYKCQVLYGGSVNPQNTKDVTQVDNIDGVLIGGASLRPDDFKTIVQDTTNNPSYG